MRALKLLAVTAIVSMGVLSPSLYAAQVAGFVIAARGSLTATNDAGETRELTRRSQFYANETLKTGSDSMAQLRFQDHALMTLKPDSQLKIGEYRFGGAKDPANQSFMELVSGGFRTISGAIGKVDKSAYRIQTPAASIGIRGTDYELIISLDGKVFAAVHDGGITLVNDLGDLNLGAGSEYLFAEVGVGQSPLGLSEMPEIFKVKDGEKEELTEEQKAKVAKKVEEGKSKIDALLAQLGEGGERNDDGEKQRSIYENALASDDSLDTRLDPKDFEALKNGDFTLSSDQDNFVTGKSIDKDGKRIFLTEDNSLIAFTPDKLTLETVGRGVEGTGHPNVVWGSWDKGVRLGNMGVEVPFTADTQHFFAVRQMDAQSIKNASSTAYLNNVVFSGTTTRPDLVEISNTYGSFVLLDFDNQTIDGTLNIGITGKGALEEFGSGQATLKFDGKMLANNAVNNNFNGRLSLQENELKGVKVRGAIAQPTDKANMNTAAFAGGFDASLPGDVFNGFKVGAKGMFVFTSGETLIDGGDKGIKIIPMAPPR